MAEMDIIELGAQAMAFPSARGRKAKPLMMAKLRTISSEDAEMLLDEELTKGAKTPPIQRIRETHHALARLLAQGVKDVEAADITGYSPSRVSILKNDPAFQELLTFYKGTVAEKFVDVHERLARLGTSFVDEIQERLEDAPEDFSVGQLMEAAKMCLDRSVAPPKGTAGNMGAGPNGGQAKPVGVTIQFIAPTQVQELPTLVMVSSDADQALLELEAEEILP